MEAGAQRGAGLLLIHTCQQIPQSSWHMFALSTAKWTMYDSGELHNAVRDCCASVFTRLGLTKILRTLRYCWMGLTLHRADRAASSGMLRRGCLAVYTKNSWCQDAKMVSTNSSPHIQLITVRCRSFHLPWKLTVVVIETVYAPLSATVKEAIHQTSISENFSFPTWSSPLLWDNKQNSPSTLM